MYFNLQIIDDETHGQGVRRKLVIIFLALLIIKKELKQ